MTEAEWLACADPRIMLDQTRHGETTRRLLFFALACFERVRTVTGVHDSYEAHALNLVERRAEGEPGDPAPHITAPIADHLRQTGRGLFLDLLRPTQEIDFPSVCLHAAERAADWPYPRRPTTLTGEFAYQAQVLRDVFGNPFRRVEFDPTWRTSTAVLLARGIYDGDWFDRLPILADALQDAGCEDADLLGHCRGPGPHVRGCWVVDLVLGKS
jgi:hypothetical protein